MLNVNANGSIALTRGDTAEFTVTITEGKDGAEYEIQENDVLTLSVKQNIKDTEYALQKTVTGTNIIPLEPADTAYLSFGKYTYDVQLTTADGRVYTVIAPTEFKLTDEVTC